MSSQPKKLRFITYLSPCQPVELFETLMCYLEEKLSCHSYLIYESRWEGPPDDRPDPFKLDEADIGFISSSSFLRISKEKDCHLEHLPIGIVYLHPRNTSNQPHYFSDVIIHKDRRDRYEDFHALKGCRWAYTDQNSLSGNLTTLKYLKSIGTNSNFFGHVIHGGGHLQCIRMVLDHRVDAAAVSSLALKTFCSLHPEYREKIHVLDSWGPLPMPPVVVNSRLPGDLKKTIVQSLLEMNKDYEWKKKLESFGVVGIVPTSSEIFLHETAIKENTKNLRLGGVYY